MSHHFLPSIKKGVNYCSFCGCLEYKNIPSKKICSHRIHNNMLNLDPLIVKYRPISLNLDISLRAHENYLKFRQKGLSKIYSLSNDFNLGKFITFKAIGIMDNIYLNNENISLENIEIISSVSILLSLEFNECCSNKNIIKINRTVQNNFNNSSNDSYIYINKAKCLTQYLIKFVKNLMYWQIFCLEKTKYNLSKYTAFDYINLFFSLGIIFTNEYIDLDSIFNSCINILELITNHYNIFKHSQYIVAMSVIYIHFGGKRFFDKKIFKYIYGVNFDKEKYKACVLDINNVLNNINYFSHNELFLLNSYEIKEDNVNSNINKLLNLLKNNSINNYNNHKKRVEFEYYYFIQLLMNYFHLKLFNSFNSIYINNDNKNFISSFIFSNNKYNSVSNIITSNILSNYK